MAPQLSIWEVLGAHVQEQFILQQHMSPPGTQPRADTHGLRGQGRALSAACQALDEPSSAFTRAQDSEPFPCCFASPVNPYTLPYTSNWLRTRQAQVQVPSLLLPTYATHLEELFKLSDPSLHHLLDE